MNVLYLYRKSDWGKELKYSIRSVNEYVNPDRIVVAGDKTELDVEHVPTARHQLRYHDVNRNLITALGRLEGEDWLLMHDDIFLLEPYKPNLRYEGLLEDRIKGTILERKDCLQNVLSKMPDARNYSLHYPLPFKLSVMKKVVDKFNVPFSYMNAYGNTDTHFKHLSSKDCKFKASDINKTHLSGLPCFSTYREDDRFEELLLNLYPNPSKYEL